MTGDGGAGRGETSQRPPARQVLVVGAGPAGLCAALDLTRRGVSVRIVDRAAAAPTSSRAKGVQPRSLEALERLGVVRAVLAAGGPFPPWRSYRGGRLQWERPIYDLLGVHPAYGDPRVPFPETWMIAQFRLESVLRAELASRGVSVEWATELTGLVDQDDEVRVRLRTVSGEDRSSVLYVLGADGAGSSVRRILGIPFDGVTRPDERHVIADVTTRDLETGCWHNWSDPDDQYARLSLCPLPGTDLFQLVAPLDPAAPDPGSDLAAVQQIVDRRSHGARIRLTAVSWASVTRANERLADRFRRGRVFLVGDAAHAVPAAGGQGMNVAIQGAANLTWKLAAVLSGAPDPLLDTYEAERRPIARRLMAGMGAPDEQGETADVFQLTEHYRTGPLTVEGRSEPGAVRAGDRAPDAGLEARDGTSSRLYEQLPGSDTLLLVLGSHLARAARELLPSTGTARVLDVDADYAATADDVRVVYDVPVSRSALFAIRPDGHIAVATDHDAAHHLPAYLNRLGLGGRQAPPTDT